jgi:biopolymer transport protein ExbB
LLGTVVGIVRAFHALDANSGKVSAGLMAEVGEALVATAIGILVALPAVAAYNYLQRRVVALLSGAEVLTNLVLAYIAEDARGPRKAPRLREVVDGGA